MVYFFGPSCMSHWRNVMSNYNAVYTARSQSMQTERERQSRLSTLIFICMTSAQTTLRWIRRRQTIVVGVDRGHKSRQHCSSYAAAADEVIPHQNRHSDAPHLPLIMFTVQVTHFLFSTSFGTWDSACSGSDLILTLNQGFGVLAVTLAMLLSLINCRFIVTIMFLIALGSIDPEG